MSVGIRIGLMIGISVDGAMVIGVCVVGVMINGIVFVYTLIRQSKVMHL